MLLLLLLLLLVVASSVSCVKILPPAGHYYWRSQRAGEGWTHQSASTSELGEDAWVPCVRACVRARSVLGHKLVLQQTAKFWNKVWTEKLTRTAGNRKPGPGDSSLTSPSLTSSSPPSLLLLSFFIRSFFRRQPSKNILMTHNPTNHLRCRFRSQAADWSGATARSRPWAWSVWFKAVHTYV